MYPDPLSLSHWVVDVGICSTVPNRVNIVCTITSRTSSPLIPAVVAAKAIACRSQQSRLKVTLTFSPLSQPISNPSEQYRWSDFCTATLPSCTRTGGDPVNRCNSSLCCLASRYTRLALTGAWPLPRRCRRNSAHSRRYPYVGRCPAMSRSCCKTSASSSAGRPRRSRHALRDRRCATLLRDIPSARHTADTERRSPSITESAIAAFLRGLPRLLPSGSRPRESSFPAVSAAL